MTDIELWEGLKKGQKKSLEHLFLRYYDDLFRYAVKFCGNISVAEDHIQDLFLRIWKRRDDLSYVTGVKTYLWTALRRSLIVYQKDKIRKSKALVQTDSGEPQMQFAVEELIIQKEEDREKREILKQALDELSPRQREIIYLRYYNGMSYKEVETITSLNYQTLRNHVHKALKVLEVVMNSRTVGVLVAVALTQQVSFVLSLLLKLNLS